MVQEHLPGEQPQQHEGVEDSEMAEENAENQCQIEEEIKDEWSDDDAEAEDGWASDDPLDDKPEQS